MKQSRGLACSLFLGLLGASGAVGQDFQDVEIETQQVGPGVYMMLGSGGNLGVSVGEDGVFLVDDQYAPLTEKITAAIREISDGAIRFVLNTHWHGDHTGGNENFGEAGALLVAHDNVRERMSVEQFIKEFDRRFPPSPEAALPVVTFSDAVTFHINDDEVHAFHVSNAHTDGDAIVHFRRANVIHMGDTYFNRSYPFIDVSSGGSIDGMIAAVEQAQALVDEDTKVIPGHGPLSDAAGLRTYHAMLVAVRDRVAAEIAQGKSKDEVIATRPTAPFDADWGGGFLGPDDFIGIVYADLSRGK